MSMTKDQKNRVNAFEKQIGTNVRALTAILLDPCYDASGHLLSAVDSVGNIRAAALAPDSIFSGLGEKGAEVAVADVWLGEEEKVSLVATEDYAIGLHLDAVDKVKGEVVYKGPLSAPIKEGDVVGELIITAPGTAPRKIPVAAGKAVNQLGFFGKAMLGLKGE